MQVGCLVSAQLNNSRPGASETRVAVVSFTLFSAFGPEEAVVLPLVVGTLGNPYFPLFIRFVLPVCHSLYFIAVERLWPK